MGPREEEERHALSASQESLRGEGWALPRLVIMGRVGPPTLSRVLIRRQIGLKSPFWPDIGPFSIDTPRGEPLLAAPHLLLVGLEWWGAGPKA
eukprot:scaffold2388_cov145-Skeletonema_menzelii.AAC.8